MLFARLARLTFAAFNIRLATRMICAGHRQHKPVHVKISTSGAGFESGKKPVCVQAALICHMQILLCLISHVCVSAPLRNQLLLKIATKLKCSKIFSADTAHHLAMKLLSNVALGRGAQLPLDIVCW
jgi:hypothetical protein